MNGRNNGKKLLAVRIVAHAFEIINLLSDQNPIQVRHSSQRKLALFAYRWPLMFQVLVDAVVNTGPREDSTRIGSQGTVRRQAVDVSPLRRVNQAIALLTVGVSTASSVVFGPILSACLRTIDPRVCVPQRQVRCGVPC